MVEALRARHYSRRTEKAYVHWIRRFLVFHNGKHPRELAEADVNRFLTHLAVRENVAASTQNQGLATLLFLYERVLEQPLNRIAGVVRARRPKRLPVVLTAEEVEVILAGLEGDPLLVCMVLYGSGLRLQEGLQLRVKDLDFGRGEILVRDGKGQKDRVTMLPAALYEPLREHLRGVRRQHEADLRAGPGQAPLPLCAGPEVSQRRPRVGLAVGLPGFRSLYRFPDGNPVSPPRARVGDSEGGPRGGPSGAACQGRHPPPVSAFVCDPPVGGRLRHPDRS